MKKWILLAGILIVGIAAFIAFSQFNLKVESVEKMRVQVEISAKELLGNYEEDELRSNENYLDKVILVEGEVVDVEISETKKSVFLETGNDLSRIICQLDDSVEEVPSIGEIVKIKGICSGYLMDVVIIRAVVL